MATAKQINEAFLTAKTKNDSEIEKATKRNLDRIDDSDVDEIHKNLMKVFNIKSVLDSKYSNVDRFRRFVEKARKEKEEKKRKDKEKRNQERQEQQQEQSHQS